MSTHEELLQFGACDAMTPDELQKLADALQWREHPAGHALFSEGEPATTLFFLRRGNVVITMRRDGREEQLAELGPASIFGEMGALLEQPRAASARAATDIEVGRLRRATLLAWIAQREPVAMRLVLNVLRIMASRLRHVNAKLFELTGSEQVGSNVRAELSDFRQKLFTDWSF
jgi:CRP/FNR family transcriptional regulator, cyclic AMP receptor protein